MHKMSKKLKVNRETLHALEARQARGGTVWTTQPNTCAQGCSQGTSCTYASCCYYCEA
jgi:hypothetical protein